VSGLTDKLTDLLECTDDQGLSMGQLMRALGLRHTVAEIKEALEELGAVKVNIPTNTVSLTGYKLPE
jgi:hypothetical protein